MKRQCADLQIRCFGENYTDHARAKVSLRLAPCIKFGPMFLLMRTFFSVLRDLTSSVLRTVVPLTRSYAGGSQFSEPATDSFANRSRFIWIAVAERSPSGFVGRGSKNCNSLHHIRSYRYRCAMRTRLRYRFVSPNAT